jgi:hypothetical protein
VSVIERPFPLVQAQPESLIIDWRLRTPIEDVSILEEDWYLQPYTGALIDETDDLRALRALQSPPAGYGHWLVRGGERSHYELRFRDAIPLEDENGEIQRSWEMGGDE